MKPSRIPMATAIVALLFLYLPILVLVIQSFNAARYGGSWQGFTLEWYRQLAANAPIQRATLNTLLVASVSTVLSLILGTLAAWVLHHYRGNLQRVHYMLVYAPLVIPDILMGMSLLLLFVQTGVPLGRTTIIIAHTTFCFSYVTLVLIGRLQDFDENLIDAARDLGARWPTIIRKILLPLLGPGLAAGALLAFTLSVDDFVITFLVAGPGSSTLPVHVYGMMKFGSPALVNALSVLFMAATFSIVLVSQYLSKQKS
jgi:spermidine/putrescine transport system permease protein